MKKELVKIDFEDFLQRVKDLSRDELVQSLCELSEQVHSFVASGGSLNTLLASDEHKNTRTNLLRVVKGSIENFGDLTVQNSRLIYALAYALETMRTNLDAISDVEAINHIQSSCLSHLEIFHGFNAQYAVSKLYSDVVDYILMFSQGRHVEWLVNDRRVLERNVGWLLARWSKVPELQQRLEAYLRLIKQQDNNTFSAKLQNIFRRIWSEIKVYDVFQLSILGLFSVCLFNMITVGLMASLTSNIISLSVLALPFVAVTAYLYRAYNHSFVSDNAMLVSIKKQYSNIENHMADVIDERDKLQKKNRTCRKLNRKLIDTLKFDYAELQVKNNPTEAEQVRLQQLEQDISTQKSLHGSFFGSQTDKIYIEDPMEKRSELLKAIGECEGVDDDELQELGNIYESWYHKYDLEDECEFLQEVLDVKLRRASHNC